MDSDATEGTSASNNFVYWPWVLAGAGVLIVVVIIIVTAYICCKKKKPDSVPTYSLARDHSSSASRSQDHSSSSSSYPTPLFYHERFYSNDNPDVHPRTASREEGQPVKKTNWITRDMPARNTTIQLKEEFNEDKMKLIKLGWVPSAHEDKWFMYYIEDEQRLYIHRTTRGFAIYIVQFENKENGWVAVSVVANRDPTQYSNDDDERDREQIRSLILGLVRLNAELTLSWDRKILGLGGPPKMEPYMFANTQHIILSRQADELAERLRKEEQNK